MTYMSISTIAADDAIRRRIAACAAQEGAEAPETWAFTNALKLAASPGWAEAWDYALAVDPEASPGAREDVITDGMILAAVQQLLNPPAPEPEQEEQR